MIKVVHLSTSVSFSSMNYRLQKGLIEKGIESLTLVDEFRDDLTGVKRVKRNKLYSARYLLQCFIEALILKRFYPEKINLPFSYGKIGLNVTKYEELRKADLIHLHWVCNFLSIKSIGKLCRINKPIIWTVHDSWPFTGGCHVRYGCAGYENGCRRCHELSSHGSGTLLTELILKNKYRHWKNNNITVVAPSKWMEGCIRKSELFDQDHIFHIPNPIDTEVFTYKKECASEKIVVLFGAAQAVTAQYKGYSYLLDALRYLGEHYPVFKSKIVLHIFGSDVVEGNEVLDMYEYRNLGVLRSDSELVDAYQNADIYALPTLDDNLPTTVLESMSCGTPVVSFTVGGVPEMIDHQKNGYLAQYKDSEDFAKGIVWLIENNTTYALSRSARKKIMDVFEKNMILDKYLDLYRSLLRV